MNDEFLENLLTRGNKRVPDSKLVSVLGEDADDEGIKESPSKGSVSVAAVEGPTMMEMMMAAHQDAKNEKIIAVEAEVKKTTKTFGGGFKKGFFGADNDKNSKPKAAVKKVGEAVSEKDAYVSWMQNKGTTEKDILSTEKNNDNTDIPTIIPTIRKKSSGLINASGTNTANTASATASMTADIQKAMDENEPPVLKQLKQGDWVTPELLKIFQNNNIIKNGLKNSRCIEAMEMMQKNSTEAKKKFQGDPEVDLFLREFGLVMSVHFEKLGKDNEKSNSNNGNNNNKNGNDNKNNKNGKNENNKIIGNSSLIAESLIMELEDDYKIDLKKDSKKDTKKDSKKDSGISSGSGPESEYGVLQAAAIERNKLASSTSSSSDVTVDKNRKGSDGLTDEERDKERVKEIVTNTELSSLLLDKEFQKILQECGDPIKYNYHMRNPDTAKKIKKMFDAGLVASVK